MANPTYLSYLRMKQPCSCKPTKPCSHSRINRADADLSVVCFLLRNPGARSRAVDLRNEHQHIIHEVQTQLQLHPSRVRPEDCGRITSIITRLKVLAPP